MTLLESLQSVDFKSTQQYIKRIITPLQSKFFIVEMQAYTSEQIHKIVLRLLYIKVEIFRNLSMAAFVLMHGTGHCGNTGVS